MEQLSGLDAAFVYFEAAGAAHVTFFAIYDPTTAPSGAVSFDDVVGHLGARLGADHLFRSVLARVPFDLDHPYWVQDPTFDVSSHVHRLTLPNPGGWRQLCEEVSQLHSEQMDLRRPPWQCWFIDGLNEIQGVPQGAFVLCFKMHHSAIDGVTGLGVLGALHDLTPETAPAPVDDWTPEQTPSSLNLLARTAVTYARRPARLISAGRHTIPALARLPRGITHLLRSSHRVEDGLIGGVPHTRFNDRTDHRRNFDARSYDLAEVSAVRRLVPGATVNDVILTGIGGALRRYLLENDELPKSSLVTVIAVSEHVESQRGANQLAVARATLGTDIADPVARLRAVHESTAKSKAFVEGVGPRAFVEDAELLPGAILVPAIRVARAANLGKYWRSGLFANTYVTSLRGPDFPIYLAGARMTAGYGLPPFTQGNGVMHNVISYCGRVIVSITGCPVVLPDIEHYGDCVDASFAELTTA